MSNFDEIVENMLELLSKEELNIFPLILKENSQETVENKNTLKTTDYPTC